MRQQTKQANEQKVTATVCR